MSTEGEFLPYGVVAREIILWLATEVGRHRVRRIPIDGFSAWVRELTQTVATGGDNGTIRRVKNQVKYLSAMTLTHQFGRSIEEMRVIENSELSTGGFIEISESFYDLILNHRMPVRVPYFRALTRAPAALDLYLWLNHRTLTVHQDVWIPWKSFRRQSGSRFRRLSDFVRSMWQSLVIVKTTKSGAVFDATKKFLVLRPFSPDVPERYVP